jgi:trans-aconitate methyltransferase
LNEPSDRWIAGSAYESFMGRWSRRVADLFLDWLALAAGLNWLDVGCGTGALSAAICERSQPRSLAGCDPSPDFVSYASNSLADCPATFVVASADNLPSHADGFDVIVSGLVLNFLPEPLMAVQSMRERLRLGGTLAAYVWDYAEGMHFLRAFWDEAETVDPAAADLDEARRFPLCRPDRLAELMRRAGLEAVATTSLQIDTVFRNFDDFWLPFRAGTGPAPSFVASLEDDAQGQLALRLRQRLHPSGDGSILLTARAFAVRGVRPS